jgi:uncharacterized protein YjeT (DUF2065 family)
MKWVLYAISFLWIILGAVQILYTEKSTAVLKKLMAERNPKVLAVVPFLIGILLCIGALWHYEYAVEKAVSFWRPLWFVFALGLIACIKGIIFFLLPPEKTKKALHWWFYEASDRFIRLWGLILVVLGIAILTWI